MDAQARRCLFGPQFLANQPLGVMVVEHASGMKSFNFLWQLWGNMLTYVAVSTRGPGVFDCFAVAPSPRVLHVSR